MLDRKICQCSRVFAELMNSHGNVWHARHLETGTDQHGRLQMPTILDKQVLLGVMGVHACNPSTWEMEGQ